MITITLGKNKYKFPSTINEFTVGQVASITNEDDPFKKISAISGAPVKELRKVGKSEMKNLLFHITESLASSAKFIIVRYEPCLFCKSLAPAMASSCSVPPPKMVSYFPHILCLSSKKKG